MFETITTSPFFGLFLTGAFYLLGAALHKKYKSAIFTPLVFSIICIIIFLMIFNIPYESYNIGGDYVNMWITPATVALGIKLEENYDSLKRNYVSIFTGIGLGVLFHTAIILSLSLVLRLNGELFATLYPKSITTAIAVGVSESLGGIVSLTVAIVVFTGVIGTIIGPKIFKAFNITDPIAQGIALGSGAHAMGTSKAIELGEVQGAMAGLSITVTGLVVVLFAPLAELLLSIFF